MPKAEAPIDPTERTWAQLEDLAPRRIGRLRASAVFLEQLLHLPAGHFITSTHWDDQRQECVLAITGPTMPETPYGGCIPEVRPAVRLDFDARRAYVIAWPGAEDQG